MIHKFRPIAAPDVPALKDIITTAELFPADMLDNMIAPYLSGEDDPSIWLTDSSVSCIAYCAPEMMTEGTWNLLLIAIHPRKQRTGLGAALVEYLETDLRERDARLLIVETSGMPEFTGARAFYPARGFTREAVIRSFYGPGDDKIVFWKAL